MIKEETGLKDSFEDIVALFNLSSNLNFLAETVKNIISKASNMCHVNLFTDLIEKQKSPKLLSELISIVSAHFKHMLS